MLPAALASLNNAGPHGLSELLYAYSSAAGNNGSAFAGLNANTPWFNTTLGIAMLLGRFAYVLPVMAMAGSLAAKTRIRGLGGHLPHHIAAVRRVAGRGHPDPWRPAILSGAGPWAHRGTRADARVRNLLTET